MFDQVEYPILQIYQGQIHLHLFLWQIIHIPIHLDGLEKALELGPVEILCRIIGAVTRLNLNAVDNPLLLGYYVYFSELGEIVTLYNLITERT